MLATMLTRRLADCWRGLDVTIEEGLQELKELCTTQVWVPELAEPRKLNAGRFVGWSGAVAWAKG